jgi:hypothetical protein
MRSLISELPTKYYSGDQIQNDMCGHVPYMGKRRGAHRVLMRKPEG